MSWKFLDWAADCRTGSTINKSVLMILAHAANPQACCWPSQATVARKAECSVRAVNAAMSKLEGLGLIERQRRCDRRGHRTTDLVILKISQAAPDAARDEAQAEPDAHRDDHPTCTSFAPYVQMVPPLHASGAEEPVSEPINEPVTVSTPKAPKPKLTLIGPDGEVLTVEQAFEVWWSGWPNKAKRKEAIRIFESILGKGAATLAELVDGRERYVQTDKVRRGFVQNPTTWLNGEGWKDEHAPLPAPWSPHGRQSWSAVDQALAGIVSDEAGAPVAEKAA